MQSLLVSEAPSETRRRQLSRRENGDNPFIHRIAFSQATVINRFSRQCTHGLTSTSQATLKADRGHAYNSRSPIERRRNARTGTLTRNNINDIK